METVTIAEYTLENIDIQNFETIKPLLEELVNRPLKSKDNLAAWIKDVDELQSALIEKQGWIYINSQKDTSNKDYKALYEVFFGKVLPKIAPYFDQINNKLVNSDFVNDLNQDEYFIYLRKIKSQVALYREENNELYSKVKLINSQYSGITGKMSIEMEGEEITMQKASSYIEYVDRNIRKEAYEKIFKRRKEDSQALNDIFDELLQLRHQIAINAGFDNFRDYIFEALGRFDYTPEDCMKFHESIKEVVIPVIDNIYTKRKKELGFDQLKPYDLSVDTTNKAPLAPFVDNRELINKSVKALNRVDDSFGGFLTEMDERGFLDLESRKNKAPGGFLYPLPVSNVPFIFMNATGTLRDVTTMVHEGGHAIHSFLSASLPLNVFKDVPAEVAEYASMAMELLTMEHWDEYFMNEDDLRRAKRNHLEKIINYYPWMAIVDHFQHWIYLNPTHTQQQREEKWMSLSKEYNSTIVDHTGYEGVQAIKWQSQLHIFHVPFYYIEYAIAQLGAIATWKQYKTAPKRALQNYKNALSLGYTKPIYEIYEAAEVKFDFSKNYVSELISFVYDEYLKLQ